MPAAWPRLHAGFPPRGLKPSCVLVQGTLKRDLPSGMSGWDLLGEEEMWDRAISHSTVSERGSGVIITDRRRRTGGGLSLARVDLYTWR